MVGDLENLFGEIRWRFWRNVVGDLEKPVWRNTMAIWRNVFSDLEKHVRRFWRNVFGDLENLFGEIRWRFRIGVRYEVA